jgi:hypothetical protein
MSQTARNLSLFLNTCRILIESPVKLCEPSEGHCSYFLFSFDCFDKEDVGDGLEIELTILSASAYDNDGLPLYADHHAPSSADPVTCAT